MRIITIVISAGVLALAAASLSAEETIRPRGKAAYEAELQALNEKYGPQAKVSELREQTQGSISAAEPPAKTTSSKELAGNGLRVTLLPVGEKQFLLSEQVFDGSALELHLAKLQAKRELNSVILLSNADRRIEIPHLLELSRLSRELNFPALYQDGNEIKAIAGR